MLAHGHGKHGYTDCHDFSRQNVNDLPAGTDYHEGILHGAYAVVKEENPDVILVASGSEVATLVDTAALLKADGVRARVVSCPSEGLFRRQSKEYQEALLPTGGKIFALTAGLPVTFEGIAGSMVRYMAWKVSVSVLLTRCLTRNSDLRLRISIRKYWRT